MQDAITAQVVQDTRTLPGAPGIPDIRISEARVPDLRIPAVHDDAPLPPAGHNPHRDVLEAAAIERQRREETRGMQRN